MTDDAIKPYLDGLLAASRGLIDEAFAAMPPDELAALNGAVDEGRVQISTTLLLPSGAVRVGVAGDWPKDKKTLWEMLPVEDVLQRPLDA